MEQEGSDVPPRINELTQRAADDMSKLAHEYAGVARREVASAGERALWPAAMTAVGAVLAVVGTGVLLASPAVPSNAPRLKSRMRIVALGYVIAGGAAAAVGVAALGATIRHALPRTRRSVHDTIDSIRDRL